MVRSRVFIAQCDFWQGVLKTDVIPVAEVLAGPVRTATTVLARFAFAFNGFFEDCTEEEMPRLFADVSHAFSIYARLDISATEQAALKKWGLVDDAVAALGRSGKKFGVERVSSLKDSLTATLGPLLTVWHDAWREAVEASDALPSESEENT